MKYPWAAIGVVLLHTSVLISCQPIKDIMAPQEKKGQVKAIETKVKDFKFIPMSESSPITCPKKYIGIGIRFDWGQKNVVIKVAPGSPAERAGIQIDDVLLTDEYFGDLPVGAEVMLPIERNGVKHDITMKVNYICYDE